MICPRCQKQIATVRVTEVQAFVSPGHEDNRIQEHRICETCAQELNLPHAGVPQQAIANIWKLLQFHKQKVVANPTTSRRCPDCGMTLEELKRKCRIGCERDYEVFADYLDELLERMHGAREHVGRIPGVGEGERRALQRVDDLRGALEVAIREEDFERAAALRDEIRTLEATAHDASAQKAGRLESHHEA